MPRKITAELTKYVGTEGQLTAVRVVKALAKKDIDINKVADVLGEMLQAMKVHGTKDDFIEIPDWEARQWALLLYLYLYQLSQPASDVYPMSADEAAESKDEPTKEPIAVGDYL